MEHVSKLRQTLWLGLTCVLLCSLVFAQRAGAPPVGGRGAGPGPPGASILGTVLSDTGQPIAGVTVRVLTRRLQAPDGAPIYMVVTTARTTAAGEFRFQSLDPGDYVIDVPLTQVTLPQSVVAAAGLGRGGGGGPLGPRLADSLAPIPMLAGTAVGEFSFQTITPFGGAPLPAPPAPNRVTVYRPTFLSTVSPAPYDIGQARIVVLSIGDIYRADLRLTPVEGRRVSGVLTGDPAEIAHLGVRLLPEVDETQLIRDGDFELAATVTDARGAFTFLGVPAGRYTLKVLHVPSPAADSGGRGTSGPARVGVRGGGAPNGQLMTMVRWAQAIVTVADQDVTQLSVPLQPAARVRGKLQFPGSMAVPSDLSIATVALYSNRPVTIAPPLPVQVAADGTFTVLLYGPGRYSASVGGLPGMILSGVAFDGTAPARFLTVPESGTLDDVRVVMTPSNSRTAAPGVTTALPPAPSPDNGFIGGRVIDGESGMPIAGATVSVAQAAATASEGRRVATTAADGGFTIGEAVAGSYSVLASAPGYAPSGFGKLREDGATRTLGIAARERITDLIVRMWRPGRLAGRVMDDRGNPMPGLPIAMMQVTDGDAGREYALRTFARTDPSGAYQFANVPSGNYVVCASFTPTTMPDAVYQTVRRESTGGRSGGPLWSKLSESRAPSPSLASVLMDGWRFVLATPETTAGPMPAPAGADGTLRVYRRSCYPGTEILAGARVLGLRAAANVTDLNFPVHEAAGRRISGSLRGPSGPLAHITVRLVHADDKNATILGGERLEAAAAISDADGNFRFLGVPAGRYTLRAWTGPTGGIPVTIGRNIWTQGLSLWAEAPVTLGDSDLSGVAVTLRSPARITGRLVLDGAGRLPQAIQFSLALQPRQAFDPPVPLPVRPDRDGSFVLQGYAPGRYGLPFPTVGGWRITSATVNGAPVPGHAIDLTTADVGDLVLTATNRFSTLTGQVIPEAGLGPIAANILIFPANYEEWIANGMSQLQRRLFGPSGAWRYTATMLPPGDYLALVFSELEAEDLTPAFIRRVAPRGQKVTLTEGAPVTLDLRFVSVR